ncbi:helix-turn-helix domain-containing protein [Streptosporangium sp. V21-05]|uniref:helix-turn-helix domain-containing protein n=1 Tax=Streptosporangium sp. V21-05 TaxID=3446115 RepID=UPI003F537375
MTGEAPMLGHVVGGNLRRLRRASALTQHETARRLQAVGVRWTRSQLAAIEGGHRESIDVGTAALVAQAFGVPTVELFSGDGPVSLGPDATWTLGALRDTFTGTVPGGPEISARARRAAQAVTAPDQADRDLSARLSVPLEKVAEAARLLWGQPLQAERDRLIREMEPMTDAQRKTRRGHITRRLTRAVEGKLETR